MFDSCRLFVRSPVPKLSFRNRRWTEGNSLRIWVQVRHAQSLCCWGAVVRKSWWHGGEGGLSGLVGPGQKVTVRLVGWNFGSFGGRGSKIPGMKGVWGGRDFWSASRKFLQTVLLTWSSWTRTKHLLWRTWGKPCLIIGRSRHISCTSRGKVRDIESKWKPPLLRQLVRAVVRRSTCWTRWWTSGEGGCQAEGGGVSGLVCPVVSWGRGQVPGG